MNTTQTNDNQPITAEKTAENWQTLEDFKKSYPTGQPYAVDMKLTNGRWACNCWPKKMLPNFYCFNEMDRPHGRYTEHHVTAIRPAE